MRAAQSEHILQPVRVSCERQVAQVGRGKLCGYKLHGYAYADNQYQKQFRAVAHGVM
jgi:hypothetical protein